MNRFLATTLAAVGMSLLFVASLAVGLATADTRLQLLVALSAGGGVLLLLALSQGATRGPGRWVPWTLGGLAGLCLLTAAVGLWNAELAPRSQMWLAAMGLGIVLLAWGGRYLRR